MTTTGGQAQVTTSGGHRVSAERAEVLAAIKARRRREFHRSRIAAAAGERDKAWAVYAWLVAEIRQLPHPADRAEVLDTVQAIAARLNERYTKRD